jgi:hypothetical protein
MAAVAREEEEKSSKATEGKIGKKTSPCGV